MNQEFLKAERVFAVHSVLKMIPEPKNKDIRDLHEHVRKVVFGRKVS